MPRVSQAYLDAQRQVILDAASRCFARNGIHATSMAQICEEAALSAGAVYRYFKSKQDILYGVFASQREKSARAPESSAPPSDIDPVELIQRGIAQMFHIVDDPDLAMEHRLSLMIHAEALRDPSVAKDYTRLHRQVSARFSESLKALQKAGVLDPKLDSEYLIWAFITMYQGFRVHKLLDPSLDTTRLASIAESLFALIVREYRVETTGDISEKDLANKI